MAGGSKKKKKPVANPARGFATTSVASKAKLETRDEVEKPTEASDNRPTQKDVAPQSEGSNGGSFQAAPDRELKDLTPEEMEAQLERSELQHLVEQIAPKVKRDSARQITRLETDRRVLRGQSEWLSTSSWLPGDLKQHIRELVMDVSLDERALELNGSQYANEEVILARIWTLQSILRGLRFPETHICKVLEHLLESHVDADGIAWGLGGSLEWLAVHAGSKELRDYEKPVTTSDESKAHEEKATQERIDAAAQRPKDAKLSKSWKRDAVQHDRSATASVSQTPDLLVSDSESDAEPERMLAKYVEYKLRLFEHDPTKFDDSRPVKKSAQHSSAQPGRGSKQETRLVQRLESMKSDPLFDLIGAEMAWRQKRAIAFQQHAERKRLGVAHQATSRPSEESPTLANAAADAASQAEAMAADVLADDDEDDSGLFEGMFDGPSDGPTTSAFQTPSDQTSNVITRSFNKISGTSPRRILEETCKARDQLCRITAKMISETTYHCRHSVVVQWSKDQEPVEAPHLRGIRVESTKRAVLVEMVDLAASGQEQSEGLVCTAALHAMFSGNSKEDKASMRLPASFRDLYQEFGQVKRDAIDAEDRETIKNLRAIIQKQKDADDNQDVILTKAFRDRSKKSSGSSTPNGPAKAADTAPTENAQLINLWAQKSSSPAYQAMLQSRMELPMYQFREHALQAVRQHQVTILCGETGCGKSTQMPSFILEDQLSQGRACRIYCTEPRRISAISLAQRVSEELGEGKNAVGTNRSMVGYAIRLESQTSTSTRLVYATVGIVLRMLESKAGLDDLTHLIIDEVHERSIDTDFLLIVLKALMVRRPDLKVVLMSATVDAERFSQYLGNAPIITVPGRTFPVKAMYLEDAIELTGYTAEDQQAGGPNDADAEHDSDSAQTSIAVDNSALVGYSKKTVKTLNTFDEYRIDYPLILRLIEHVAKASDLRRFSKAILIFLPGISEIRQLTDMLGRHPAFSQGWLIHPLHSTFTNEEQQAAFRVPPNGMRKIVLATNIAETGITIPDVTCVVDTGKHKEMRFDERRQLSRLIQSFISRANAKQRRGRAGRVQEGICFHLFTKHRHDKIMAEQQTPEMLRLSLQDLVMRVKICKLGDIETALSEALDPPSIKNIRRAIDALIEVGALTSAEDLTPLGQQIAKLPLDAQLSKLILLGSIFACADFALTTAAIASSKSPFISPMNARRQADTVRLGFKRGDSDLLTTFNAYKAWRRVCSTPGISEFEFCKKNFLSPTALANIEELKGQLLSSLLDAGFLTLSAEERMALSRIRHTRHNRTFVPVPDSCNQYEVNDTMIQSVIAWSFYPKILVREGKGWRSVANNQSLSLHPTSVNKLSPTPAFERSKYLSFYSIMQSSSRFTNAQETTPVEAMALVLLAGDAKFDFYAGVIIVDGNRLKYKVKEWWEMVMIKAIRSNVRSILNKGWKKPGRELSKRERQWWDLFLKIFHEVWEKKERATEK
ncbi:ATP-dependent RNA helicase DHX36 [Sphaceloma murrayae]|uniref:RNA helicase n=1 Tax=Sphaceloma murrayae TaxID=2082308 RepID=A0A2K1QJR6_9PEZI|nr:ATP-dependent RNA helicase DHX36 [Sphaceloma murrayae]